MPRIDLKTMYDTKNQTFFNAIITSIDSSNDTANIIDNTNGQSYSNVPIFYHCKDDVNESDGSLEGGSSAFEVSDNVTVSRNPLRILASETLRSCTQECFGLSATVNDKTLWQFYNIEKGELFDLGFSNTGISGDELPGAFYEEDLTPEDLLRFQALKISSVSTKEKSNLYGGVKSTYPLHPDGYNSSWESTMDTDPDCYTWFWWCSYSYVWDSEWTFIPGSCDWEHQLNIYFMHLYGPGYPNMGSNFIKRLYVLPDFSKNDESGNVSHEDSSEVSSDPPSINSSGTASRLHSETDTFLYILISLYHPDYTYLSLQGNTTRIDDYDSSFNGSYTPSSDDNRATGGYTINQKYEYLTEWNNSIETPMGNLVLENGDSEKTLNFSYDQLVVSEEPVLGGPSGKYTGSGGLDHDCGNAYRDFDKILYDDGNYVHYNSREAGYPSEFGEYQYAFEATTTVETNMPKEEDKGGLSSITKIMSYNFSKIKIRFCLLITGIWIRICSVNEPIYLEDPEYDPPYQPLIFLGQGNLAQTEDPGSDFFVNPIDTGVYNFNEFCQYVVDTQEGNSNEESTNYFKRRAFRTIKGHCIES